MAPFLRAAAAAAVLAAVAVTAAAGTASPSPSSSFSTTSLANEYVSLTLTVSPSGTCVSSLAFSLSLAGEPGGAAAPFTPNLITPCPAGDLPSATLLDVLGVLASPAGGTLSPLTNSTYALVQGVAVGAGVATEDWELSLAGAGLTWSVRRTFTASGTASSDSFPALWFTTTTGGYVEGGRGRGGPEEPTSLRTDWRAAVQLPSFLSLDGALLNPETGVAYPTASSTRVSVLGDHTAGDSRRVLLGPSGVAMHVGLSACRFAMSRQPSIFTQHIGIGAECAAGPYSDGYPFVVGDVRENTLTLDFRPATQGHGYFDLSVPPTTDNVTAAALEQLAVFARIYQLPMGWINGNSPQCETCIHEISVFPELNGLFRLVAPPTEPPVPGSPAAAVPASSACPSISNPFCGFARSVNTVSLGLECMDGAVISSVAASYGTPNVSWPPNTPPDALVCGSFVRDPACDDAGFQAYAEALCVGQRSCTLLRNNTTPDPCPNVEKDIVAVVTCSGGGGGGRPVPPPGVCPSVHDITAKFLTFLLPQSVRSDGYVSPRWDIVGGNDFGAEGIIDQMPHMVLAAYHHAVNTNDTETVGAWMPAINRVAEYMLTTMWVGNTSLLTNTNPLANGVANVSLADNWLDDVRFGFHDAIVGAYGVESFRALGDLRTWVGDAAGAAEAYSTHAAMVQAYNDLYWDPLTGSYFDWVDVTGRSRSYFYTWQNYYAIETGIANASQAQSILARADALYASARAAYNLTEDELWCTPTNMLKLDMSDLTVNFDSEGTSWGFYENGDCFGWHFGLESVARARVQGPEAALARLVTAMGKFSTNRLWGQRYHFLNGTDSPAGSDVITDGFWLAYGSLFGALNVRPTLLQGIQVLGPAAPQLEGLNFTFAYQGADTTVTVQQGWARVLG